MPDHIIILRVRSHEKFTHTRRDVRSALTKGLQAWGGDFTLISMSPVPASRYIAKRKSPTRRNFPLLDYIEGKP
jgi:hypothetical protein